MRRSKIEKKIPTERIKEIEKLIEIKRKKQLSNAEEIELFAKIRSGESELIEKLVDSWEVLILSVVKQIPTEIPLEELIAEGRKELTKLANQEVNSVARESFFRFGAWCVKQGIMIKMNL